MSNKWGKAKRKLLKMVIAGEPDMTEIQNVAEKLNIKTETLLRYLANEQIHLQVRQYVALAIFANLSQLVKRLMDVALKSQNVDASRKACLDLINLVQDWLYEEGRVESNPLSGLSTEHIVQLLEKSQRGVKDAIGDGAAVGEGAATQEEGK